MSRMFTCANTRIKLLHPIQQQKNWISTFTRLFIVLFFAFILIGAAGHQGAVPGEPLGAVALLLWSLIKTQSGRKPTHPSVDESFHPLQHLYESLKPFLHSPPSQPEGFSSPLLPDKQTQSNKRHPEVVTSRSTNNLWERFHTEAGLL